MNKQMNKWMDEQQHPSHLHSVSCSQLPAQRRLVGQAQTHRPVNHVQPRPLAHHLSHSALSEERGAGLTTQVTFNVNTVEQH